MDLLALKIKFARYQWAAFALVMLLQRSPAIKVVSLFEKVLTQPLARIVQSTTWVATSMGVFHATAGATGLKSQQNGGSVRDAKDVYVIEVGEEVTLSFNLEGVVVDYWEIDADSDLVDGLSFISDANPPGSLEGPFDRDRGPGGVDQYYRIDSQFLTLNGAPTTPSVVATADDPATDKNVIGIKAYDSNNQSEGGWYSISIDVPLVAPGFIWHPRSMRVPTGGRAQFFFQADSPVDAIQWLKNGLPIADATEASLVLADVAAEDAGLYSVRVTNEGGESVSEQATLTIDDAANANFVNLATRGRVGVDADILIPGFTVLGGSSKTVLFRGLGPELEQFGINDFLPDPQIELVQTIYENGVPAGQQVLFSNDNWEESPNAAELASVMQSTGKTLPAGSKDAALLVTLGEGVYTIKLSGVDGATGVGLAELFVIE